MSEAFGIVDGGNVELDPEAVRALLSAAKGEYDNEGSRTSVLDAKMNIMLPLASGYFMAVMSMNPYVQIFGTVPVDFGQGVLLSTLFLSYTLAVILASGSMYVMLYVLLPKKYVTVNAATFYNIELLKKDGDKALLILLTRGYIDATNINRLQNDDRAKWYQRGCVLFAVSLFLFLIYNLIKVVM